MSALGSAALIAALAAAVYAAAAALIGTRGDRRWVVSARRAIYAMCGLMVVAVVAIETLFVRSDLSVALVAEHSSTTTPLLYKLTALWGSQAGSLMLWAFVLSIASAAVLHLTRNRHREVVPWATAVLAGVAIFFLGLMVAGILLPGADSWPFAAASPVPAEGAGLTPLLRHPAMAMHPPMLYSGYVFFTIPFAFAIGALITRRLDASWIRSTRRFALVAWIFLSIGLALGARWSYSELGWGGYWAWDPVENAALIPWLTGTAFLHSIMVQERRGMLRVWNVSLICATFALSLLGTFLVRSGVLQSIHAFGESKVGPPLLALIAVVVIGSTVLIASRLDSLRSERRLDSLFSREAIFLLNNVLLVGLAAVVAWGHVLPADLGGGHRRDVVARGTVVQPLRDAAGDPVGPLHGDRPARRLAPGHARGHRPRGRGAARGYADRGDRIGVDDRDRRERHRLSAVLRRDLRGRRRRAGVLARHGRPAAPHRRQPRGRARIASGPQPAPLRRLRRPCRAGPRAVRRRCLIELPDQPRPPAQPRRSGARVGDYTISYERPTATIDGGEQKLAFGAVLDVSRDGRHVTTLSPSREYYSGAAADPDAPLRSFFEGEATSEVGRAEGFSRDLWSAMQPDLSSFDQVIDSRDQRYAEALSGLSGAELADPRVQAVIAQAQGEMVRRLADRYLADPPPAEIRFNVNPFVVWFWLGVIVAVGGALFAIWPMPEGRRRRVSDVYGARLARELGSARQ